MFKVKFWGVRGSIPCPGPNTSRYGGNTTCIQIITDQDYQIIIDLGSGARELAADLLSNPDVKKPLNLKCFLSHTHWDHIMGFPFFVPIFIPTSDITIYGPVTFEDDPLENVVGGQLTYRYFPVRMDELKSDIKYQRLKEGSMELEGGIKLSYRFLNHPVSCLGYRFEYQNKVVVTCFDHEPFRNLFEGDDPIFEEEGRLAAQDSNNKIMDFIKDADLLIHDSQYTEKDYNEKFLGWGHSSFKYAIEQSLKANVKNLALFHHDPARTDDQLDYIHKTFQEKFSNKINIFPAIEKSVITLAE